MSGPSDLLSTQQRQVSRPHMRVVTALIYRQQTVLIQQRLAHKPCPLLWEFPGGKVEPQESDITALIRECFEELAVEIRVGELVAETTYAYPDIDVTLLLYHAYAGRQAKFVPKAAKQLAWVLPQDLSDIDLCPADKPLIVSIVAYSHRLLSSM